VTNIKSVVIAALQATGLGDVLVDTGPGETYLVLSCFYTDVNGDLDNLGLIQSNGGETFQVVWNIPHVAFNESVAFPRFVIPPNSELQSQGSGAGDYWYLSGLLITSGDV
jgi:hypothetical protein